MTTTEERRSDIRQAVKQLKALRPAYEEVLGFYEGLCLAQEESKQHVELEPGSISKDLLEAKRKGEFPLISPSDFSIDFEAADALLSVFCRLAEDSNELLAKTAKRLHNAVKRGDLETSRLFEAVLVENENDLETLAREIGVDKKILAFIAYSCVKPSVCVHAEQLSTAYLGEEGTWGKGYCPICGSPPAVSILRGEGGQRVLVCALCAHEWQADRIYCPFCENTDSEHLAYFFSETEKECRVAVCDKCGKYIKTIDARQVERPVYPFIEQVASIHLDMMAEERGFMSGIPLWLQYK